MLCSFLLKPKCWLLQTSIMWCFSCRFDWFLVLLCVFERVSLCSAHGGYALHAAWPVGVHSLLQHNTSSRILPGRENKSYCRDTDDSRNQSPLTHCSNVWVFRLACTGRYYCSSVDLLGWFSNRREIKKNIMCVWLEASMNREVVCAETCDYPPCVVLT